MAAGDPTDKAAPTGEAGRFGDPTDGDAQAAEELLSLTVTTDTGWTIITVAGELDISTSPDLREAINGVVDSGARHIVIDLNGLRFMDSSGLNVFVGALRQVAPDGSLRIATARPHIRKVFAISGLDRLIPLFDSVAAAGGAPPLPAQPD